MRSRTEGETAGEGGGGTGDGGGRRKKETERARARETGEVGARRPSPPRPRLPGALAEVAARVDLVPHPFGRLLHEALHPPRLRVPHDHPERRGVLDPRDEDRRLGARRGVRPLHPRERGREVADDVGVANEEGLGGGLSRGRIDGAETLAGEGEGAGRAHGLVLGREGDLDAEVAGAAGAPLGDEGRHNVRFVRDGQDDLVDALSRASVVGGGGGGWGGEGAARARGAAVPGRPRAVRSGPVGLILGSSSPRLSPARRGHESCERPSGQWQIPREAVNGEERRSGWALPTAGRGTGSGRSSARLGPSDPRRSTIREENQLKKIHDETKKRSRSRTDPSRPPRCRRGRTPAPTSLSPWGP